MTAETHRIDKELVMAYLEGELAPVQAARIANHLDQCAECRELAADLRGTSSQMLVWSVEPAPKHLSDAVFEELNNSGMREARSGAHQKVPRTFSWKNVLRKRWVWATAGCTFFLSKARRFALAKAAGGNERIDGHGA
jgi:anti-sigma factor RsiW